MGCLTEKTFKIRKGDTLPKMRILLADKNGVAPDFTGATGTLRLLKGDTVVLSETITLFANMQTDSATGEEFNAEYTWADGDTEIASRVYRAEVYVVFASGDDLTFPTDPDGNIRVEITKKV